MNRIILSALAALALSSSALAGEFQLRSDDIRHGQFSATQISNVFGCSGGNRSPQLSWTDPPAGTKSFVISISDQDAPTGSGWWHWTVANIPASARSLPQGAGSDVAM